MSRQRALTLLELLLALVITAVLCALLSQVVSGARARARSVTCISNLRQASAALLSYTRDNRGRFPPSVQLKDPDKENSGKLYWSGILIESGYAPTFSIFFCPEQTDRPSPLSGAFVGYGANRYGLMPTYTDIDYRPASINTLSSPSGTMMLAEANAKTQPYDGWYIFSAQFASLASGDDDLLLIKARHDERASVAFVDGHIESRRVRSEIYEATPERKSTNLPWAERVNTHK